MNAQEMIELNAESLSLDSLNSLPVEIELPVEEWMNGWEEAVDSWRDSLPGQEWMNRWKEAVDSLSDSPEEPEDDEVEEEPEDEDWHWNWLLDRLQG